MKCEVKMYNYNHPKYLKEYEKWEEDVEKMRLEVLSKLESEDEEDEEYQDDILRQLAGEEPEDKNKVSLIRLPKEPIPVATYKAMNLKDDLILAYSLTPDTEVVKIYMDVSKIAQEYFVIKKDDKIIEKLDKILN